MKEAAAALALGAAAAVAAAVAATAAELECLAEVTAWLWVSIAFLGVNGGATTNSSHSTYTRKLHR